MKKNLFLALGLAVLTMTISCGTNVSSSEEVLSSEEEVISVPVFTGVESKSIPWGSTFDPLDGVTASDKKDGDLTSKITVEGVVDTFRSITHELTYKVKNSLGKETIINRQITVEYATEDNMIEVIKSNRVEHYESTSKNFNNLDFSQNGTDSKVPGWQSWGTGGSYSVEDGIMKVEVGTEYYQISNNENYLKEGQYYIVTFDAKADKKQEDKALDFTFRVIWGSEANGGWNPHTEKYWDDKPINTEWQTYAFLFKAVTNDSNCLCLITQGIKNTIYYKNINVYEVNPTSDPLEIPDDEIDTNYDLSSNNDEYWDSYGIGEYQVETNKLSIKVNDGYYQVANHRNKMEVGKKYTLEYDIKSSVSLIDNGQDENTFKYKIIVGSEETGWTVDNDIYPTVDILANEVAHISVDFIPKYATKNVFAYIFQGFVGDVEISNIKVHLASETSTSSLGTNWNTFSGQPDKGSYEVNNQEVTYTGAGSDYYQISNNGNELVMGKTYVISFEMLTTADLAQNQFKFLYGDENGGWHPGNDQFLTEAVKANEKKLLKFEFTATSNIQNAYCFVFMNYNGVATLNNFKVEEK